MTWTERLKQFSGFGGESRRAEMAAILPMMTDALARLRAVADLAPTATLQNDVRPVVAKGEAVVQHLRDVLRDFGEVAPVPGELATQPNGQNHWARLLQALDRHREVRQRLRELSIAAEDENPALSQTLADIGREEEIVVEHLRDLIALADPQALN